MSFGNTSARRNRSGKSSTRKAAIIVLFEPLEIRQLLSTYQYNVPMVPGGPQHTSAYLEARFGSPGKVDVMLDSPLNAASYTFNNTTGQDIVDCGSLTGFKFYDQIPAALKPTADTNGDTGIKVQGGSGGTLEIDAGVNDTLMQATDVEPTYITITTTDTVDGGIQGISQFGVGVTHITFRTNDVAATDYYPNGGSEVDVGNAGDPFEGGYVLPLLPNSVFVDVVTGGGTYDTINLGPGSEGVTNASVLTGAGHDVVTFGADPDNNATGTADFGEGGGLGLGNELNVEGDYLVTLEDAPGSAAHTIFVDTVNMADFTTLQVDSPSTIGDLELVSYGTAIIDAPSQISTLDVGNNATAEIEADTNIDTLNDNYITEFTGASTDSTVDTLNLSGIMNADYACGVSIDTMNVPGGSGSTLNGGAGADVAIDTMNIDGSLNAYLSSVSNIGVGTMNNNGNLDVEDGGLMSVDTLHNPSLVTVQNGGELTVGTFDSTGYIEVESGGSLTVDDPSNMSSLYVTDTDSTALFKTSQVVGYLDIEHGGLVTLQERAASPSSTSARVLTVSSLTFSYGVGGPGVATGTLDIKDNDLIVHNGSIGYWDGTEYTDLSGDIAHGRDGGAWDQTGIITSMSSALAPNILTTIGIASGAEARGLSSGQTGTWGGQTITDTDALIKYTYGGDANVDGQTNGDDYFQIDSHVNIPGSNGYYNGDFNYDGAINGDDYFIIDSDINQQGSQL